MSSGFLAKPLAQVRSSMKALASVEIAGRSSSAGSSTCSVCAARASRTPRSRGGWWSMSGSRISYHPRHCGRSYAGLIEEFSIALAPVLFGAGSRLFEGVDAGSAWPWRGPHGADAAGDPPEVSPRVSGGATALAAATTAARPSVGRRTKPRSRSVVSQSRCRPGSAPLPANPGSSRQRHLEAGA